MSHNFNFYSLLDILQQRSQQQPSFTSYIFLRDGETESARLTYEELNRKALSIAAYLRSIISIGDRALLMYPSGLEYITAFFGCLYAGVVAVPVHPPRRNQKLSRLLSIVNDAQAKVALTTISMVSDLEQKWQEEANLAQLKFIATDINVANPQEFRTQFVTPESLAFLQYTSGSTGTPKGVMVTHGNIIHNQQLIQKAFGHSEESIVVGWLPLFHDMGLIGHVLQPIYVGFTSVLMPPVAALQKPIRWLQAISNYRANTSGGPNFAYDLCVKKIQPEQLAHLDLSSWDLAYSGAEPIRADTLEQFSKKFAPCDFKYSAFYPCYGMAETTLFTTGGDKHQKPVIQGVKSGELEQNSIVKSEISSLESRVLVGCGRPYMDTTISIVNPESLTRCSLGQVGEIWVSGESIASGYWNRPQATQETFQAYLKDTGEGPYLRTGDLGFFSNGELFVTGRLKDVIIIRGRNYYPQDIELTIENSHISLRNNCSAAFSIEIQGEEHLVVACEVERTYLRKLKIDEIVKEIQIAVSTEHELEIYRVVLLKTGSIFKTSSGKIRRHACKLGFLEGTLNIVGEWSKTLENKPNPTKNIFSNSQLKNQHYSSHNHSKTVTEIEAWLSNKIAELLQISPEEIELKQPLAIYGLNSAKAVSIAAQLEEWFGIPINPTIVYDYPSIQALANYFGKAKTAMEFSTFVSNSYTDTRSIAIIGKGCRFPKANNPQDFWSLLRSGDDVITQVPVSRWQSDSTWGGFLEQVDQFDPQFFNISPREASNIDPQQRLLLEVGWEALEDAGLSAERLAGSQSGVFIGISSGDYARLKGNLTNPEAYYGTGNALSIAANRLSYFFDWHGPSWAVDTACSSSLVAVHQACQSLSQGECNLALAGGVNLILSPHLNLTFSKAQMLSKDGRCKTFDAGADGYVRSEGCGVVILKRLSDAIADRDNIQAIIRGSAVNQDGLTNGITAPNGNSQQEVIQLALARGGVKPNQISYIETHGTGTALGDPIEVNSLIAVLMEGREQNQPCQIGSVKTNIGHLEAAAGIAGLIKLVLSLEHGEIPPHLHLKQLNPYIKIDKTPIKICTHLQKWPSVGQPRLAGVSAFGFGGTNAHIILEEAPKQFKIQNSNLTEEEFIERPHHILTLSTKCEKSLKLLVRKYQTFIENNSKATVADICFTANTGRALLNHRLAVITSNKKELAVRLAKISAEEESSNIFSGKLPSNIKSPKIAFLFTGQGSQYINMGRQLYETQPVFRQALDLCKRILQSYLEKSILEIIYPEDSLELNDSIIDQTDYTQPVLFSIEYALTQLWQSWGIKPDVLMGHSVGEYVAATIAGVFSLEDGLKLIAHRGHLMHQLPLGGKMLAVMASLEKVNQLISLYKEKVVIAAINGPQNIVISGVAEAINILKDNFDSLGIKNKLLRVSHAFHSPLMQPMLADFEAVASEITYNQPRIPLISNITGTRADDNITTASYWINHVCQPVKFGQSMKTLYKEGYEVFLEIGPKPVLLGMGRQCLPKGVGAWFPSLRYGKEDWKQILKSLAELYIRGVKVDWSGFEQNYSRNKVPLPTYPFQRQHYWIDEKEYQQAASLYIENGSTQTMNNVAQDIFKHLQQDLTEEKYDFMYTQKSAEVSTRHDKIVQELCSQFSKVFGFESSSKIDIHNNFMEMGADSLILIEAGKKVEEMYGVNIPMRKFFEELTTLHTLATYIDENLSSEWMIQAEAGSEKALQQTTQDRDDLKFTNLGIENKLLDTDLVIIQQQLQVMSKQLEALQNRAKLQSAKHISLENKQPKSALITSPTVNSFDRIQKNGSVNKKYSATSAKFDQSLSKEQQIYLKEFLANYTNKTQKSKQRALACRPVLADKRAAVGFHIELKEMKYPIVGESSSGSKIWDIDGNEYIDISMGFGVHLLGHQPEFVVEALQNQLKQGMQIGPQANLAGEVAQLVNELTAMERVAFCNSGTEAVMTALRLVRTATGRNKIVIFDGAYHGQFDGILALSSTNNLDGNFKATPMFPGVLQNMVEDVVVLTYGSTKSLDIIKAHAHDLAAILVEPVQSRQLELQPKEFLQQLRQLTKQLNIPLIFDEVITGFRIHPGGAQSWFDIKADIATFGKCIGSGLPIGIVAGESAYMDGIDGGQWKYGDASYPQKLQTFFAGTFNKNPLSMAAALSVLKHLKNQGSILQQNLNRRTSKLIAMMNAYFKQENVPIKMVNFGSIFRFVLSKDYGYLPKPIVLDILFYSLIEKGIYMWEGRNGPACFLSTAHTDEDIDRIILAVKESISEMRQGGFFLNNN